MNAMQYNHARGYEPELVARIQRTVGASPSGEWDEDSVAKVCDWQAGHGLEADGKVGPDTLASFEVVWAADLEPEGDEHLDDDAGDHDEDDDPVTPEHRRARALARERRMLRGCRARSST